LAESRPWFEEHASLTRVVEELFQQVTQRFAVPTASGCGMVAITLMSFRSNPRKRHRKPKAVRSGELFLRHLAAERRVAEYWISLYSQGRPVEYWFRRTQELLAQIDQTQQCIESLLPALWPKHDERDPVRQVAEAAKAAWGETNSRGPPRSTNPDDPLCRFIVAALAEIGQHISAAEVSEVLRGRRRKPKDGQKR
jgi:hypothetical protein